MQDQEQKYEAQQKRLREAAEVGIADINSGSFQSFDAPERLRCYLRELARDALSRNSLKSNEE